MTQTKAKPRRRREPGPKNENIYRRWDGQFEVGIRDSAGRMIYPGPFKNVTAAREKRDEIKGDKAKGVRVQPNAKLKFGIAADSLLGGPAKHLRPATQAAYRNAIDTHLRKPWGRRQLSSITSEDVADLVKELREAGKAEWTISQIVRTASRVFTHAQRRCDWHGINPCAHLEKGERPNPADTAKRRIFKGDELPATLAAAHEPYRLLFTLAAVTGARLSELLGLTWDDIDLHDVQAAEVRFVMQLERGKDGERVDLKTRESRRTVELPHQLAALLMSHRDQADDPLATAYVFATRSGRAIGHRNVTRELHRAMSKATDRAGELVFPILSEKRPKVDGKRTPLPRGEVPTFHSFRHTAASEAIAAGESVEEVSWQLGHKSSVVTRAIYVQEVKSAERTARRRSKMEARLGTILEAAKGTATSEQPTVDKEPPRGLHVVAA